MVGSVPVNSAIFLAVFQPILRFPFKINDIDASLTPICWAILFCDSFFMGNVYFTQVNLSTQKINLGKKFFIALVMIY